MDDRRYLQAARRLPFVGRKEYLQRIKTYFRSLTKQTLYYVEADGGIGKTELLTEILKELPQDQAWIANTLIDLYHVDYHSHLGLAEGIYKVLRPPEGGPRQETFDAQFMHYREVLSQLRQQLRARAFIGEGEATLADTIELKLPPSTGTEITWAKVWQAFAEGLSALAQSAPVVIALDTVEILEYERDDFQRMIHASLPMASVGDWLLNILLPQVKGKILWLWAGRHTALKERFSEELKACTHIIIEQLPPLSSEDSIAYLEQTATKLEEGTPGCPEARRIREYLEAHPKGVYAGSAGRPILLALAADILSEGGGLPKIFYLEPWGFSEETETQKELQYILVEHLFSLDSPVGKTLLTLGLLRKGADADLLGCVMGESPEKAQEYLDRIANLAIVKRRQEGQRIYFLHDEIYKILADYGQVEPSEWREWEQKILEYYQEKESEVLEKLRQCSDLTERESLEAERCALQVELVHYQLYMEPEIGFETYFVHAEEALDGRNRELDMLLRTELLRTVHDLKGSDRLDPELEHRIQADTAVRWGIRYLLLENDLDKAQELFAQVRTRYQVNTQTLGPVSFHIRLYETVAKIYHREFDSALADLQRLEQELGTYSYFRKLPSVGLLVGLTSAYLGYVYRLKLDFYQAINYYQQAIAAFEQVKAVGMQISTQSNQAYAMATAGYYRRAESVLREALRLVWQESSAYWEVQVRNGLVIVYGMAHNPLAALEQGKEALRLLHEEAPNQRLNGLACTNVARAYRYLWNEIVAEQDWHADWQKTLWPAYQLLDGSLDHKELGALALLRRGGEDSANYVEALSESGCVLREMAWLYRKMMESGRLSTRTILGEAYDVFAQSDAWAEQRLLQAAGVEIPTEDWKPQVLRKIKKLGGNLYLPTIALSHLGWHCRYQRRHPVGKTIQEICDLIEDLIPEDYHLPAPGLRRGEPGTQTLLWMVLSRTEQLRFDVFLEIEKWNILDEAGRDLRLKKAIPHAVYSMEYNYLTGDAPHDLKRAEQGLVQRVSIISASATKRWVIPRLFLYAKQVDQDTFGGKGEIRFLHWLRELYGKPEFWGMKGA